MLEVETVNSKKTKDENVKLAKVFKALSSNIEKNNELLDQLFELTLESESNHQGLAPLRSILSKDLSAAREDKVFEPSMMWTPKLIILNIDGSIEEEHIDYSILHSNDDNPPRVQLMWRFKAFFKENLELQHFPVDVQDLTISISTEKSIHEIEIIEDQSSLSSVNTQAFLDASEWNLYNHTESYRDKTTVEYARSTVHSILHIQCRVARKIGYFVWNIIFIVFLIIGLTFASYSIEVDNGDRLAVNITLFLTAVTFKLVVKQSLPTISYLTYLDLYVLAALIFLALNATQNAAMKSLAYIYQLKEVKIYDRNSIASLAVIFILFHIVFGIYIAFTVRIIDRQQTRFTFKGMITIFVKFYFYY
uniref:Gamma-aminobutyric acid receptor subunit gamma-2 n=1 Tax=Magallana gigas TaxID=29159 RepID=K1Q655_MAGGI